jgi:hypothetical protein
MKSEDEVYYALELTMDYFSLSFSFPDHIANRNIIQHLKREKTMSNPEMP